MPKLQQGVPLRPEVHDYLDGRLNELLGKLDADPPHGDLSAAVRRILSDYTHVDGVPLRSGEKLLSPDWECGLPLTWGLFGNINDKDERIAKTLYELFTEMARFVLESGAPEDKKINRETLTKALRIYLSRRGYDLSDCSRAGEREPIVPATHREWGT